MANLDLWRIGGCVDVVLSIIIRQNNVWLNDKNLFISAAARSPNSVWARTNVAEDTFCQVMLRRPEKNWGPL